jgi:hypothetical protein
MRDALLHNIRKKVGKYSQPPARQKLQQQFLAECYPLVYYDEAVLYNNCVRCGFGFQQIAAIVLAELRASAHPFDKLSISVPHEPVSVIEVWP